MSGAFFLLPPHWPAVLVLPLLLAAMWWNARRSDRLRERDVGGRLAALAGAPRYRRSRGIADGLALAMVGVALLQPVAPGDEGQGGADVVLCVDASWSMAARDQAPTRLGAVQREIAALAGIDPESRVALVVFAGDAAMVAPLTADLGALSVLADELAAGAHGRAGSDPGAAIDRAEALLRSSPRGSSIVVLSDGEDFVGQGAAAAGRAFAAGHPVHTFGCGDEAGSKIVVDGDGGEVFLRDGAGADVVSRLEAGPLQAMAEAGGGHYRRMQPGCLRSLHDAVLLPAARTAAVRAGRLQAVQLFPWALLGALGFWMLRLCLPERRR